MGELAGISGREAVKKLQKLGYRAVRQKGSHVRLLHPDGTFRHPVTIPLQRELKIGLLLAVLKNARISPDEFLKL